MSRVWEHDEPPKKVRSAKVYITDFRDQKYLQCTWRHHVRCSLDQKFLGVPYGNRTCVAAVKREAIYRNSKETCGMDRQRKIVEGTLRTRY